MSSDDAEPNPLEEVADEVVVNRPFDREADSVSASSEEDSHVDDEDNDDEEEGSESSSIGNTFRCYGDDAVVEVGSIHSVLMAIERKQPFAMVKEIIDAYPAVTTTKLGNRMLLHQAICSNPPDQILEYIFNKNPNAATFDSGDGAPLNFAGVFCSKRLLANPTPPFFKKLIDAYPQAIGKSDGMGHTPLGYAMGQGMLSRRGKGSFHLIQYMVKAYPVACLLTDCWRNLPLDREEDSSTEHEGKIIDFLTEATLNASYGFLEAVLMNKSEHNDDEDEDDAEDADDNSKGTTVSKISPSLLNYVRDIARSNGIASNLDLLQQKSTLSISTVTEMLKDDEVRRLLRQERFRESVNSLILTNATGVRRINDDEIVQFDFTAEKIDLSTLYEEILQDVENDECIAKLDRKVAREPGVLTWVDHNTQRTLLHRVCMMRKESWQYGRSGTSTDDLIKFLVEKDPTAVQMLDCTNRTPLHYACMIGPNGRDVVSVSNQSILLLARQYPPAIGIANKMNGWTPLHYACNRGGGSRDDDEDGDSNSNEVSVTVIQEFLHLCPKASVMRSTTNSVVGGFLPLDFIRGEDQKEAKSLLTKATQKEAIKVIAKLWKSPVLPMAVAAKVMEYNSNLPSEITAIKVFFKNNEVLRAFSEDEPCMNNKKRRIGVDKGK